MLQVGKAPLPIMHDIVGVGVYDMFTVRLTHKGIPLDLIAEFV